MNRVAKLCALIATVGIAWVWALAAAADSPPPLQPTPIRLQASKVLPGDLLRGDNFTVQEAVSNDGYINTYKIYADYGELEATGTAELKVRIGELRAITVMEQMSGSKEFGGAAKDAVVAPVKVAGKMVTSPVKTTKGIFTGTGRYLANVGRSVGSSDPHQDNVFKTALGYDATKRGYAYELGFDPYTSYEPAADALGRISRASLAGGLTVSAGMQIATAGTTGGMVLSVSSTSEDMRQLSRDNPPGTLRRINIKKLKEMGVDEELAKAFAGNHIYNPQERTLLVGELETMDGVADLGVFISSAHLATDEATALFWRVVAQMMAGYHAHVAPVVRVRLVGEVPVLEREDGGIVVLGADDYVFWTQHLSDTLKSIEGDLERMQGVKGKEYWLTGKMDPPLREYLSARGWLVAEEASERLIKVDAE